MEFQRLIADIQYQLYKIEFCKRAIKYGGDVVYFQHRIDERQKRIEILKKHLKNVL
jgi:signal peptidase I